MGGVGAQNPDLAADLCSREAQVLKTAKQWCMNVLTCLAAEEGERLTDPRNPVR